MRDNVLWRKQSHIIMMLAKALHIDAERALDLYYSTKTAEMLADARYGLQLMSDQYILDDILTITSVCMIRALKATSYGGLARMTRESAL